MAMVMLLYRNYSHLKYNHHMFYGYALKPWSPLIGMAYTYWLLNKKVSGLHVLDIDTLQMYL
jgi:hypothetical protein